jgi:predicted Zn-dependent protease
MIFTWSQVASFFGITVLVGWLLYPNEYFLGQMHQKAPERAVSIEHFIRHLSRNPTNKGAALSLAETYESVAAPESAIPVLERLYGHRRGDRKIGERLLELYENAGDLKAARRFRWKLFEDLSARPDVDRRWLENFLYRHYQHALIDQDDGETRKSLDALLRLAKNPDDYWWDRISFLLARRDHAPAIASLRRRLESEPGDPESLLLLADLFVATEKKENALSALEARLLKAPDDPAFLKKRVFVNSHFEDHAALVPDLKKLIALEPKNTLLRDSLALHTLESGDTEGAVRLYREEVSRRPEDRDLFMRYIDALERSEKK